MTDKERIKAYVIKVDDKYYRDDIGNHLDLVDNILTACIKKNIERAEETKDYIINNRQRFGIHSVLVVPITIQEGESNEAVEALKELKQWVIDYGMVTMKAQMGNHMICKIDRLIKEYGWKDE